jgi:diacylglycerol kinase (ATP)
MREVSVIINPVSGTGRARALRRKLETAFQRFSPLIEVTSRAGEEEELARRAAQRGAETVVVVGGDGTWGNAAHGILASGSSPRLALIAAGTGNDFAKSVAAPAGDPEATALLIESGAERLVDVGFAGDRAFLNCCGTGFDTAVLARSDRMRAVSGAVRYLGAALAEILSYQGERVHITPWPHHAHGETLLTVFANGRWYGGMFHIAPHAKPDDGALEAIRIGNARGLRRLRLLGAAVRGEHIAMPGVELASGQEFTLTFETPPLVNTDGELRRAPGNELIVRIQPGALRLVAPPPARSE